MHLGADGPVIWDSLAICEYLAEQFPKARLWPDDPIERARARSVSAEMHSGFTALRSQTPTNLRARRPDLPRTPELEADIARIQALWRSYCQAAGTTGPFLFGRFSIADAMFAPVVARFTTYAVDLDATARAYMETISALPAMNDWRAAAEAEPWTIPQYDP